MTLSDQRKAHTCWVLKEVKCYINQHIRVSKTNVGRILLHCLDKLLDAQTTRAEHDAFEIKEVKLEGMDVKPAIDPLKAEVSGWSEK